MQINRESHPYVVRALNLVDIDNGIPREPVDYAIPFYQNLVTAETYEIPKSHVDLGILAGAESELKFLSEAETEALCMGEHEEIEILSKKAPMAHMLLGDYFNGWQPDPDSEECCGYSI